MYYNHFSYLIKIKFDNGFLDTILEGCQTKMIGDFQSIAMPDLLAVEI